MNTVNWFLKASVCLTAICLLLPPVHGQVKSNIESVTVYLSGVQIDRKTEVSLSKGENEILFQGLSASLDLGSIQITAPGSKIISLVPFYTTFIHPDSAKKIALLTDSLTLCSQRIKKINRDAEGFVSEEKLLNSNMQRIGSEKGVSVLELQNFSAYYQKRVSELKNKLFEFEEQREVWQKKMQQIQSKINKLNSSRRNAYDLVLKLKAENAGTIPIRLTYVALNAGWSPFYDVRVKSVSEKVKFNYRASIINDTQEDWTNVKLKLSSANPTLTTQAPELDTWKIDFVRQYAEKRKLDMMQYNQMQTMSKAAGAFNDAEDMALESEESFGGEPRSPALPETDVNISALSIEFEIKEPYSVPSDGKNYSVDVNEYELTAQYSYKCVPKLDRDAFLIAGIVGWEQLNLIEGKINLYFADTYVGESYLNPRSAGDTLKLSLGRDKKVIVKRSEIKDFSKIAFMGSNKRETSATEIEVRNTNNVPIEIEIFDQIPISKNSDIEVTTDNLGGAGLDSEKGHLRWVLKLKETESKRLRFEYTVKYPKNKNIERSNYQSLQNQRKIYKR